MVGHVRDAVRKIDDDSWLIDELLILRRQNSPKTSDSLWNDGQGWHYSIFDASPPLPPAISVSPDCFPKKIHDAGDASVVFDFGEALLRVKDHHPFKGVTPEPVTLHWLAERNLSFPVPKNLHYTETADRIYFIVSRVPGRTIDEAWRDLSSEQKQRCVDRVAEICVELSAWTSDAITGVDGNLLFDPWLAKGNDLSPETLLRHSQDLGLMDCSSTLVFNHNDLGPTNVMVDGDNDCDIGIIDWEMAGYVPFAWVRTKLAASWAMDFCWKDVPSNDPSMAEWRERVAEELGKYNVVSAKEKYLSWR